MSKTIFAQNIKALLKKEGVNQKEAAKRWKIDHARLRRWSTQGIEKSYQAGAGDLERLRKIAGYESIGEFWRKPVPLLEQFKALPTNEQFDFVESLRKMLGIKETVSKAIFVAIKYGYNLKPKPISRPMAKFLKKNQEENEAYHQEEKSIFNMND